MYLVETDEECKFRGLNLTIDDLVEMWDDGHIHFRGNDILLYDDIENQYEVWDPFSDIDSGKNLIDLNL